MLKNKRGDGYIQACVMILILCLLIAVCLTYLDPSIELPE